MKRLRFISVFVIFAAFCFPTFAASYYVSPSGNDSNPGSQTQPWKTINKAAGIATTGDTVTIAAGVYNENVTFFRSGVSSYPVIFSGTSSPKIVASNTTNTSCLSSSNACILGSVTILGSNVTFKNMEVAGPPTKPGTVPGINVKGNNNEVSGNFVHNSWKDGIYVNPGTSTNKILNNHITYASISAGIYFEGSNHLIQGNTITHSVTRQPDRSAPVGAVDPDGIRFFGSGTTVKGNTIKDIYLDESPESDDPHSDCFQSWGPASNIIFDGNFCELESSTTYVNPMVKLLMLSGSSTNAVSNIKIINNVFVSKTTKVLWNPIQLGSEACSAADPMKDVTIANNTFVHTGSLSSSFAILMRCVDTANVKNNIFYNYSTSSYPYIYQDRSNNLNVSIFNNSVFNTSGAVPKNGPYPGDNISETWMKNPQLADVANLDFHLTSVSPLINRGTTIPGISYDFDNIARPQGSSFDIGAFEHAAPDSGSTGGSTSPSGDTITVCGTGCNYTTIQAAVNTAQPGKTIEVQSGVYKESVYIPADGTSSSWITLKARDGDEVWIDGGQLGNVSNINLNNHSYWKIVGLKMRLAAQGSSSAADGPADGVTIASGGHDVILQKLTIEAPNGDGIDLRGANYNIQLLDNEIYDMRIDNPNWEGDGHGIHVLQQRGTASSHDILVKGNYVHDSHGKACLALSDYSALNAPAPTNVIFEYNEVKDCTNGIKINADGIFRYNLIVDTKKYTSGVEKPDSCFQAFTHDSENNVRKAQIYNNTTVGCNNAYNFDMTYNGGSPTQTYTVFKNNIAYNPTTYFVRASNTNFSSYGNNLFYKYGGSAVYKGYIVQNTDIVNSDPMFNFDYTLKTGSPAIDKGSVILTTLSFSGSAPDIGTFEYSSSITPPPPTAKTGDANADGNVDESDYSIWSANYGKSVTSGASAGDFNLDGKTDGIDYVIWLINFGK
ncbi:MAG: hypothetical protein UU64_C0004G0015 [candidate division WWE3 bacterium GW2011_GWF2_41_45]|uniref:DUF1565 domain-containing protein n=3 Tax=Katanobacteria TaxID=422282 RepID=A0A1F4W1H0_UNCKA|nr:MAG: hypothetical protein UU55_C0007G0002 [candidate division WWE3 bacterium GW2011_GWC2_41_23]KKS10418.1 MAG: hypothetical protein UU64_C0004G0015 [candidate division WWE3 bacterium GW2011_GWF2_41_45]KKS12046.1 MAG: hypothetical protein UU68_C0006G0015 [candidate division WWE3 bacterium GW2011_GWF1_41_53]KKS20068.1 MAG: hypothetical protein UU79_C0004G0015 [candidate division WWE3 bacterium GW2011_GWE1_41_72]KKS29449.1 MAG: hypothetical protein UU90_C0009G0002 [candidate division WWE3 bacte